MNSQPEETAIERLDRIFPIRYGSENLIGLGQFIRNLTLNPGDPETDAENIAIAFISALDLIEEADTV